VCATGLAGANLIVDVVGYLSDSAGVVTLLSQPARVVDTRAGSGYPGAGQAMLGYGSPRCFVVAGQGGVPADALGVIVNLTAIGYSEDGWLTLYPNGQAVPATSSLNYDLIEYAIANTAIVRVGSSGQVCLVGSPGTNAILDVSGYLR
jgi:hypothetical protein